jgi:hypothetical protein
MGRPKVEEAKQQYTLMLKPSVVKQIDRMADKYGLTRSHYMANLVQMGLDEAKILEKVGVFKFVQVTDAVMLKFKEALATGKVSLDNKGELKISDEK